jgi:hypothetical protein
MDKVELRQKIIRAVRKSYLSDITDEQWELLKGFIPSAKPDGRPRKGDNTRVGKAGGDDNETESVSASQITQLYYISTLIAAPKAHDVQDF